MTRVKRRWSVEHTWTCSACRALNKGRDLSCTKCGKPKSDESYDERDAVGKPAVTDPKLVAMSKAGPNWDCVFCRFENRAGAALCVQCGADRALATTATVDAERRSIDRHIDDVMSTYEAARSDEPRRSDAIFPPPPDPTPPPDPPRTQVAGAGYRDAAVLPIDPLPAPEPSDEPQELPLRPLPFYWRAAIALTDYDRNRPILMATLALAAIALFAWFLMWLFMPWHEHVRVTSATWQRTTELQHRVTLHGQDWGTPPGAFNTSCVTRQHGTHDCNPYDCNPHSVNCHCHDVETGESCSTSCTSGENGFSECEESCSPTYTEECDTCTEYDTCYEQCPTYDQWCDYDYYDWPTVRTEHTSGTDRDPIVWPAISMPDDGETYRFERAEHYDVHFGNGNGTWTTTPDSASTFGHYHVGARWDIEVTHAGSVSPVREETGT